MKSVNSANYPLQLCIISYFPLPALCEASHNVGKTTTAVNLGIGLAQEGKKVLLLDADAQGSLTLSLGYKNPDDMADSISTIIKMVMDEKDIPPEYAILHHSEGVDLIPANIELAGVEVALMNIMSRELILKTYLNYVKENYDFVIIDCSPSLGMLTVNALAASDSVIIPSQPHYLSIKGLQMLLLTVTKVQKQLNPNLKIDGILLTMVDRRTSFANDIIDILRNKFSDEIMVFNAEIPVSVRAIETTAEGKSIYAHDKMGKVSLAYENFTKEVLENAKQKCIESRNECAR